MNFPKRGEVSSRIMRETYERESVSRETIPEPKTLKPGECPRCKQQIGRGFWMHVRHCKGVKNGQDANPA